MRPLRKIKIAAARRGHPRPSFRRRPESRVLVCGGTCAADDHRNGPSSMGNPRPVAARICPHLRLSGLPLNARESAGEREEANAWTSGSG